MEQQGAERGLLRTLRRSYQRRRLYKRPQEGMFTFVILLPRPRLLGFVPHQENVVRHRLLIRAGSRRIWRALTTGELENWFATRVLIDWPISIHIRWKNWGPDRYTGDATWHLEVAEAHKHLAFRWKSHPTHPETRVDIRFQSRGPITRIEFTERGFGDDTSAAMANAVGWGEAMTLLKFYVEHGLRY